MVAPISDMFSFDSIADDEAKARRDGMITDMMGQTATSATPNSGFQVSESNPTPASMASFMTNAATIGRESNDYGGYSTGMGYAKNVSLDLAKALRASGLGAITGRR